MAAFRSFVQPYLAAPFMMEVLHRVGEVQRRAIDSQFSQRTVEQPAGRARERLSAQVLAIARLFPDQHHLGACRPLPEHGLRGLLPERALAAGTGLRTQTLQAAGVGGRWHSACTQGNPALRCLRRPVMHFLHTVGRIAHQARQQLCLGQVAPVLGRHLLHHHPRVEPGRIEDAGVVGLPQRFACVLGRGILAPCAGTEGKCLPIPGDAARRSEDGPVHAGEAAREERRDLVDNVVLRLEPGDECIRLARHLAEAHECLHLVRVTADGLGHGHGPQYVGIGGVRQHRAFAMGDAPQQPVQQGHALHIAMTQAGGRQFQEVARYIRCASIGQHGRRADRGRVQQ